MNGKVFRFSCAGVGLIAVLSMAFVMTGQESSTTKPTGGLVTDWTSRHIVFSGSGTPDIADKIAQDQRYKFQWARRNFHPVVPAGDPESNDATSAESARGIDPRFGFGRVRNDVDKDWGYEFASTAFSSAPLGGLLFPAKYSFSTTTAMCSDFVVYPVEVVGSSTAVFATDSGTVTSTGPTNGQTATITNGANTDTVIATASMAATANGTVTAVAPVNGQTATITNGANVDLITSTAAAFATGSGTFTTTGMTAGQTISITGAGGSPLLTLVASNAPTGTAVFGSNPAVGSNVVVGSNTYTFEPLGACAAIVDCIVLPGSADVMFAAGLIAGNVITVGASTYTFEPNGGCGATTNCVTIPNIGTATFSAAPAATSTVVVGTNTYTYSAFSCGTTANCVDLAGMGQATFATVPVATNTVVVGANTYTYAVTCGATANCVAIPPSTGTATFSAVPAAASNVVVGADTYTFSTFPCATAECVDLAGTGQATFATAPVATNTVVVGANTYTYAATCGATANCVVVPAATGTITAVTATPANGSTLTVGGTTYTFEATGTTCTGTTNCIYTGGGPSLTNIAQNIEAAIDNTEGDCGTTYFSFSSFTEVCFSSTAANASVTATEATTVVTLTNITAGAVAYSSTSADLTFSPTGSIPAPATAAQDAANLEAAINANSAQCGTTAPCYGTGTVANPSATATIASTVVTVTDTGGANLNFSTTGGHITVSPSGIAAATATNDAENLNAAIGAATASCAGGFSPCYGAGTAVQTGVSATNATTVDTVTNANATAITFTTTSGSVTLAPSGTIAAAATVAQEAANLEAAINANSAQCGTTAPCYGTSTVANPSATATLASLVVTVTDTGAGNLAFSTTGGHITTSPTGIAAATAANDAANLAAAITITTATCAGGFTPCYGSATTVNANATAAVTGAVVSVTNSSAGTDAFTTTSGSVTLAPTGGSIPTGNTTTNAENLYAAINDVAGECGSASPCFFNVSAANASATAYDTTNVVSLQNSTGGTVVFTKTATALTLNPATGTIPVSTTTLDSDNLEAGINNTASQCGYPAAANCLVNGSGNANATAATATNTTTVTNTNTTANDAFSTTAAAITLTPLTGGIPFMPTNGFVVNNTAATDATNLIAAINKTGNGNTVGVSAATGGSGVVNLTATTIGAGSDTIALSNGTASNFAWSGATLSGGTTEQCGGNGTGANGFCSVASVEYFAVTSSTSATALSSAQIATNMIAAFNANVGATAITAATGGASIVKITANTAGAAGNSITLTEAMADFSWASGMLAGGADLLTGNQYVPITDSSGTALSAAAIATNMITAFNANVGLTAITASSGGSGVVMITANTAGAAGNSIGATEGMTDFGWTTTTLTGGKIGQASIIAYNNLYIGTLGAGGNAPCGGSAGSPPVKTAWAYNTGGTVTTSPTVSLDGTQVAFVQNDSASEAQLVILKPLTNVGIDAYNNVNTSLTMASSGAVYRSCAAPCAYVLTFALDGGTGTQESDGLATEGARGSSVWYDYGLDRVFVGDDRGYVHQFTGVFNGTPQEVTTTPWPIAVPTNSTSNGDPLTSVVFDESRNVLYVGDFSGELDWINVTTGAVTTSGGIGGGTNDLYDGPLVDPTQGTNGEVYESVSQSAGTNVSGVYQLPGEFAAAATGTLEATGSAASTYAFTGTFDNTYYTSSVGTGHFFVCGVTSAANGRPAMWSIPITANVVAAGTLASTISTTAAGNGVQCSSVTEAYNGTTDYMYTGVVTAGSLGTCAAGGCVLAYSTAGTGTLTLTGSAPYTGGISGVIIDNFVTGVGASQIYFSPLGTAACTTSGTGGCAVQAAQVTP
jgi:hypothetical protein